MRRIKHGLLAAAALATGACSLAPDYNRPNVAVPDAYKEAKGWQTAGVDVPASGKWWELFSDATLSDLEGRIEAGNPSLAAAVARYDQAVGLLRQSRADRYPEVDLGAGTERTRVSAGRPLSTGSPVTYNLYTVGPSLSYEIDLFGRVRNSIRAAAAEAQASQSDVAGVRLGLQSQLAAAYFDLRGLDARIVLLRQTIDAYQRAYDLTDTRHGGGIASGIDVSRAENQLASARAELSSVLLDRQRDEHAIAVLVGETPATFSIAVVDRQLAPPAIPGGVPSTLLQRRPDIAAAERRVAEANARIGVARAALFPSLTLGLSGGFESTGSALLGASNGFWALGPLQAAMAIFDGGRRRAGVRIARAEYDETVANYRQTVLTAFREVEDDLAAERLQTTQERDQLAAARAAERTRDLAMIRYRDGASDYLDVVTAQTAALDAERALLQLQAQQLQTAVDTVRALGGSPTA